MQYGQLIDDDDDDDKNVHGHGQIPHLLGQQFYYKLFCFDSENNEDTDFKFSLGSEKNQE